MLVIMGLLFFLIVIGCMVYLLFKTMGGAEATPEPPKSNPPTTREYQAKIKSRRVHIGVSRDEFLRQKGWENTPRKYFIAYNPFPIDVLPGYESYSFVGTQYREDVSVEDVGWFNGFAFCEATNQYDKYAIAIFREDGKQLGYLPKGEIELWQYLFDRGCIVHAYGALSYNPESDKWIGVVAVESDKDALEEDSARFDNPNITFYEPNEDLMGFIERTRSQVNKMKE